MGVDGGKGGSCPIYIDALIKSNKMVKKTLFVAAAAPAAAAAPGVAERASAAMGLFFGPGGVTGTSYAMRRDLLKRPWSHGAWQSLTVLSRASEAWADTRKHRALAWIDLLVQQ